ncbi:DEAD/DEAH box helicase [Sporolactobacillus kofuensis]
MLLTRKSDLSPNFSSDVQRFLYGKEYRAEELPFSDQVIKEHLNKGYVTMRPAITAYNAHFLDLFSYRKKWQCNRCGNRDQESFASCSCARCRKECVYCRHCLTMGIVRACSRLVRWVGPAPAASAPKSDGSELCTWTGTLSEEQNAAAFALDHALAHGDSFLVWAVTGSGKTEIIYKAIDRALREGHHVALATPRTDVVRELLPRLRSVFPTVSISGLYAGSEEAYPEAQLVISTAHQLIHYANCFDCIFIDEVDAFPFHYDPMLAFAVQKAAKPGAPIGYLTATPPEALKSAYLKGKLKGVKITRRYHGHPLPVPRFHWVGNWTRSIQKGQLPKPLLDWLLTKKQQARQLFLFVPTVTMVRELTETIQKEGFVRTAGVHAEDPDRHTKVNDFRNGKIRILVTTTILERGVTVPGVEVAVLGADDRVFDTCALVQISGRVGRSSASPSGDILFFHNGKTLAMVRARRQIEQMNKEGGF